MKILKMLGSVLVQLLFLIVLLSVELLVSVFSKVGRTPFFDQAHFPWIKDVEAHCPEIRKELDALLAHKEEIPNFQDLSRVQKTLTEGDDWKTFMLYTYGFRVDENCAKCPATDAALKHIPKMRTAMFSILEPGKHIPPHRGPFNGLLRYQLGLKIPGKPGDCRIRVKDEICNWTEGKSLVFDDSFKHEAWNNTDQVRAVLFVDFDRPLPKPVAAISNGVFRLYQRSPLVKEVLDNLKQYN